MPPVLKGSRGWFGGFDFGGLSNLFLASRPTRSVFRGAAEKEGEIWPLYSRAGDPQKGTVMIGPVRPAAWVSLAANLLLLYYQGATIGQPAQQDRPFAFGVDLVERQCLSWIGRDGAKLFDCGCIVRPFRRF